MHLAHVIEEEKAVIYRSLERRNTSLLVTIPILVLSTLRHAPLAIVHDLPIKLYFRPPSSHH